MRVKNVALVTLVLGLCLLLAGQAVAATSDANSPQRLFPQQTVSGTLDGSSAGSFHYYAIPYPGDGSVVTVKMVFTPGDDVMRQIAGFNVYGLNGASLGSGILSGEGETKAAARVFRYADHTAATWLIQVYNYAPGQAINYSLVFEGLPVPAATPTPAATITPGQDIVSVLSRDARYSTLVAAIRTAGLTDWLRTPGPYTLLAPTNDAFAALPAATWRELQADPSRLAEVLRGHVVAGIVPRATLRSVSSFTTLAGTTLSLGVEGDHVRIGGVLSTGGDILAANGVIHSLDGVLLSVGGPAERAGTLAGNGGGAFVETRVLLKAGADTTVTLNVTGGAPPVRRAVGLNVYGPEGTVAAATAENDPFIMKVTFVAQEEGIYLFQIYNYDPAYTLSYRLTW